MNQNKLEKKIAVIGSGIAGIASAYYLQKAGYQVSLFEAGSYFGGHTNTVDVSLDGHMFPVDTGFLVHNDRTYPNLVPFFEELGVEVHLSNMSFSVQHIAQQLYWAGKNLNTVFAQRKNLFNPRFYRFLKEIVRFNKNAQFYLQRCKANLDITLRDLLEIEKYSADFSKWYLLPMGGSIWSTPITKMLDFPAYTFLQFSMNHGLLQLTDRPQWKTVVGGCRTYVNTALAKVGRKFLNEPVLSIQPKSNGVELTTAHRTEMFDACIVCTHPPQTVQMLSCVNESIISVLRSFRYQPNMAVLHTDVSILPPERAWSAWNYTAADDQDGSELVSVSYLINMLQPLPTKNAVVVTLNSVKPINPAKVIKTISYDHPLFDSKAVMAQQRVNELQGSQCIYFAGAWMRYGFHEDGIVSAKWAVNKLFKDHGNPHLTVDVK